MQLTLVINGKMWAKAGKLMVFEKCRFTPVSSDRRPNFRRKRKTDLSKWLKLVSRKLKIFYKIYGSHINTREILHQQRETDLALFPWHSQIYCARIKR